MAVNDMPAPFDSSPDDSIEPIDPNEIPEPFDLHPKWGALDAIDAAQIVLSYDRRSDSLIVHFFERGAPYVAVESGEWTYLLVDPETELVTGLRFDAFLDRIVPQYPEYVRLLEISELRGITAAEVLALRRRFLPLRDRLTEFLFEFRAAPAQQKQRLTRMVNPSTSRLSELASV
jgi:hypothetical protein